MDDDALAELLDRIELTTGLDRQQANRVVQDVLAFFGEGTDAFVRRRHGELRRRGLTNTAIYERIGSELASRRVTPPRLSERQIRRLIYG
jgi:hypothetical protein